MPIFRQKFKSTAEMLDHMTKTRKFEDVLERLSNMGGHTFIRAGQTPTDKQFTDLARQLGNSNANKALESAGLMKKEKGFGNLFKGVALGGGFVAGGALADAGVNAISNKSQDLFQDRAFEEMLKIHPKLQLEDKERVRTFFNTLWTFAPDMAKDPLVSGSTVYQAMKMDIYGGYPVEAIKTVVEIQHKRSDTKGGVSIGTNLSKFLTDVGSKQVMGIYS